MSQYIPAPYEPFGDDKLVAKVNSIDTNAFVLKIKYDAGKLKIEKKILILAVLLKIKYNTKITEIEGKIPDVSSLATNAALTTVENKIPDISSLAKKTDYNSKITEIENKLNNHIHDKCITTPELKTLVDGVFNKR